MIADAYLTRTGIFIYRNPDGSERREYRPPEEVFRADSLESFQLVPLTDDHPPEMLNGQNSKKYAVGTIGESVRKDGDKVAASIMVFDAATIAKMEAGKAQLSCGYEADVEDSPGEVNGHRYDAIQRNIRGNHVAIVDTGRAGPDVRVRMDAAIMIPESVVDTTTQLVLDSPKGNPMEEKLTEALTKVAELEAKFAAEKTRADKAEAASDSKNTEIEALKADLQKEKNARQDSENSIGDKVRARVNLETKAIQFLGKEAEISKLSDRELKLAVVKKLDNVEIQEEKSEDYVNARFDASVERAEKSDAALAAARVDSESSKNVPADAEKEAYRKMIDRNRNLWKGN
jgi:hypothetical protein